MPLCLTVFNIIKSYGIKVHLSLNKDLGQEKGKEIQVMIMDWIKAIIKLLILIVQMLKNKNV